MARRSPANRKSASAINTRLLVQAGTLIRNELQRYPDVFVSIDDIPNPPEFCFLDSDSRLTAREVRVATKVEFGAMRSLLLDQMADFRGSGIGKHAAKHLARLKKVDDLRGAVYLLYARARTHDPRIMMFVSVPKELVIWHTIPIVCH